MPEELYRLTGSFGTKKFCACVVVKSGVITETAPILKKFRYWKLADLKRHAKGMGWTIELVPMSQESSDTR